MISIRAYAVHCLTASGIIPAAFAMREIASVDCDLRIVFLLLLLTTLIDSIDGPLARRFSIKHDAPAIDGRTRALRFSAWHTNCTEVIVDNPLSLIRCRARI